ncbi:uncharacterized protein [Littorina saxatilis]|uniref:Uncharacterized protein n=1 Tax=Littorina saxatilis TaxID=31220 RepID=A0AAN9B2R2_9CAEN
MDVRSCLIVSCLALVSHVHTEETPKLETLKKEFKGQGGEWEDVIDCFKILTNQTSLPTSPSLPPADITRNLFKAICGTKEQFLNCVDSSLQNSDDNSVIKLFRPLFNVSMVTQAYNDLCSNLTVTDSDEDLSCLLNSTALLPCYNEYYNYLFYLSVVKRFGSPKRQLSDDVLNTLLCTLAEERRDCEVAALSVCSTKIGLVMQSFYQKTLPSACKDDEAKDEAEKKQAA